MARLGNLLQSHEQWGVGDTFNELSLAKVNETIKLCEQLRHMCSLGVEVQSVRFSFDAFAL